MRKRILATTVLTLFLAVTAFSQTPPNPGDQKSKEALKELFQQVRDWAQTDIIPKMKDWKTKLDNSMSSDDLKALNALRDQAAQIKGDGKKLAAALKKAWQNNNFANVKRFKEKIKELGEQREELLKDLKPLALKYKGTLVEIGKEAKPYGKEWKEGIKKVVTDWYENHKNDLSREHKKAFAKGVARLKMLAGMDETLKAKIAAARFMLWDGKDLPEAGQLMDDESLNPDATMNQTPEGTRWSRTIQIHSIHQRRFPSRSLRPATFRSSSTMRSAGRWRRSSIQSSAPELTPCHSMGRNSPAVYTSIESVPVMLRQAQHRILSRKRRCSW